MNSKDKAMAMFDHLFAQAERFLTSTTAKDSRKNWDSSQKITMKIREKSCPTCSESLDVETITREHIFPLILGGKEKEDNVVAMCEDCNDARNQVMGKYVGSTKIEDLRAQWPENRDRIFEFIAWSMLTVVEENYKEGVFPEMDQLFYAARGISIKKGSVGWFERIKNATSSLFSSSKEPPKIEKKACPCLNPVCELVLKIPIDSKKKFRCPTSKGGCGEIFSAESLRNGKKISQPVHSSPVQPKTNRTIFPLKSWLSEHRKNCESIKELYVRLKVELPKHEDSNSKRPFRTILQEDHGINKIHSLDKVYVALEKLLDEKSNEIANKNEARVELQEVQIEDLRLNFIQFVLDKLENSGATALSKLIVPWNSTPFAKKGHSSWQQFKKKLGYSKNVKFVTIIEELLGNNVNVTRDGTVVTVSLIENKADDDYKHQFVEEIYSRLQEGDKLHINNLFSPWNATSWYASGFRGWKEFKKAMGYGSKRSLKSIVQELVGEKVLIIQEGNTVYVSLK